VQTREVLDTRSEDFQRLEAISRPEAVSLIFIVLFAQVQVMKDNQTKARFMELRAQGLPLAKIAAELQVSKNTLVTWGQDLRMEIANLEAMELEAMYDKYRLSTRKQVEFFGETLSRIQGELETRDLSGVSTEKLFGMYAHFYQEAQRVLPKLVFRSEDEITLAKEDYLSPLYDMKLSAIRQAREREEQKKLTKS
jgi:hypothetical protein